MVEYYPCRKSWWYGRGFRVSEHLDEWLGSVQGSRRDERCSKKPPGLATQ